MKFSRKFLIAVIMSMTVLLVLIFVTSTGRNHFRKDAARWTEPSVRGDNLIDSSDLKNLKGEILFVNLMSAEQDTDEKDGSVTIDPDKILERQNFRMLRKHKGPVVLLSKDQALTARIWMILSQTGIKELYILTRKSQVIL